MRSCGRFGAGQRGHDRGEVEFEGVGVDRIRRAGLRGQEALGLGVGFDQLDRALRCGPTGGGRRATDRSTGKKPMVAPYSGAMLAMVARSASGRARDAVAEELDELADDALLAEHLGDA
jgi:hypothetical protein